MAWPPTTHQDVQDEVDALRGPGVIRRGAVARGQWYTAPGAPSAAAYNPSFNTLWLVPVWFPTGTVDIIASRVASAGPAGQVVRMGIYTSSATTALPDALRIDAGTLSTATAGVKEFAVAHAIKAGLYYVAACVQEVSGTVAFTPVTIEHSTPGVPALTVGGNNHAFAGSAATGALPASAGTIASLGGSAIRPWFRMAP